MAPSVDYAKIPTEGLNPRSRGLDRLSPSGALRLMDREDARMLAAVRRAGPAIARAVEILSRRMAAGGRLFLAGAGTSGRLCVLEAAECPPTFNTAPGQVTAFMAGGKSSVFRSREGAEDRETEARSLVRRHVRKGDVLVGVAASGVTAFAGAALQEARRRKAATVLVTCNPAVPQGLADVVIAAGTGAEVVSGSTRMKAGTATKIILNRLTTLAMVRLGKTWGPYMVDLQPRSKKLVARALRLIGLLGGVGPEKAARCFQDSGGRAKTAIVMARLDVTRREAERKLSAAGGYLGKLFALFLLLLPLRAPAAVLTGLDVLEKRGFAELKGKRVGVICNHTAVDAKGRRLPDLLLWAKDVRLSAIFAPEHGFAGTLEHGYKVENSTDPSGVPIYSLYGETKRPSPEILQNLDVLVFDIQDAGARFYTYITTLGYALEAAKRADIEMIVLDRPNPARGDVVEGEILAEDLRHFTAYYSIPVRHGLTVGEIALWHNKTVGLKRLTVIPMEGWRRDMDWKRTGLRFTPPSPNIRFPKTALLYPGIGAFESTNVAVGRGTKTPFELFGAPWLDGKALASELNVAGMRGVRFEPAVFTPTKDRYAGQRCSGVRVVVLDPKAIRPVEAFVRAAFLIRDRHAADFILRWDEIPLVTGSRSFEDIYKRSGSAEDYLKKIHEDAAYFIEKRKDVLLYE